MLTLHDEVMINGMRLRNRVALPPLTTNYGSPQGLVTEESFSFTRNGQRMSGLSLWRPPRCGPTVVSSRTAWDYGRMGR